MQCVDNLLRLLLQQWGESILLKDYEQSAKFYPMKHATRIISVLREMDMKSKGLGAHNTDDAELLTEMVYKILNVDKTKVKV